MDGSNHALTVTLKRLAEFDLQIFTADGQPAANAEVVLVPGGELLPIKNNQPQIRPKGKSLVAKSDTAGRVKIMPRDDHEWLVVIHERGWAMVPSDKLSKDQPLTLEHWSRVEGVSRTGTRPDADSELMLRRRGFGGDLKETFIDWEYSAKPDTNGGFVFERVPGGRVSVSKAVPLKLYAHWFSLQSGATASVSVGGTGRPVAGKFVMPAELADNDTTFGWASLQGMNCKSQMGGGEPTYNYYVVAVNDDGTFQAADIVPDEYSVHVEFSVSGTRPPLIPPQATAKITVPPAKTVVSDDVYQVPPIPLKVIETPKR